MNKLHIVYRSCDHTEVHPERGPRYIQCDKKTLIKKSFTSLLNSVALANEVADISIHIIDDHSSEETINFFKKKCDHYNITLDIEVTEYPGYNYSAYRQFEKCRKVGTDLIYSVEDDYLHFPEAIRQMVIAYNSLRETVGSEIAIRPDDDLFTYSPNNHHSKYQSIIVLGDDRHWRSLTTCHNTFLTHVSVLDIYWELFASLAKYFDQLDITEDDTINKIWQNVPLFSPIPSLALHVSQNNQPPFIDYMSLWDSINVYS